MLYCTHCKKEVVIFGISFGVPGAEEEVDMQMKMAKQKGYLILFNPPPENVEKLKCPGCGEELREKR